MKKIITIVQREAGQFFAVLFCLATLIWLYGCQSKVMSLHDNGRLVTRAIIAIELDTFMKLAEIRYADLDRQDAFKHALIQAALLTTQTGTVNPLGVLAILFTSLGVGATVDNVKLRVKIKKLNSK